MKGEVSHLSKVGAAVLLPGLALRLATNIRGCNRTADFVLSFVVGRWFADADLILRWCADLAMR
jgi:hypothetical protein